MERLNIYDEFSYEMEIDEKENYSFYPLKTYKPEKYGLRIINNKSYFDFMEAHLVNEFSSIKKDDIIKIFDEALIHCYPITYWIPYIIKLTFQKDEIFFCITHSGEILYKKTEKSLE